MEEEPNAFLRLEKGRVEEYRESEEIPLCTDVVIVGRPPRIGGPDVVYPDLKIKDEYISRDHVKIFYSYDEKCFMVEETDSGTKNGTFINNQQIPPGRPCPLKDGDLIGLAKVGSDYRVILRFRESEATLPGTDRKEKTLVKGLYVDPAARRVWASGKEIPLRRKEFDLLAFLAYSLNYSGLYHARPQLFSRSECASSPPMLKRRT